MMRNTCPTCGQSLPPQWMGVRLTPLKARIFDAVRRAGPDGIEGDVLFWIIYADHKASRRTLKSHIGQINDLIEETGFVVRGRPGTGGHYKLQRTSQP